MTVNRCICHDVTFATLIEMHRREGLDADQLAERTGCTTGCGLCLPYVRLAIATGQADLPVMSPLTIERKLAEIEAQRKRPGQ